MFSSSDSSLQKPVYVTIRTGSREVKFEVPAVYHEMLPKVQECMPHLAIETQVHIAAALALNKTRKNKPIDKNECESVLKRINGTKITSQKFKDKAIALSVFVRLEDFKEALVAITDIIEHAPGMANLYLLRAYFASLSNHPLIDALVQTDLEHSRLLHETGIDYQNDFEESYHFVKRESFFSKGAYNDAKDSHFLALQHASSEASKQKLQYAFLALIDLKIESLVLSDPDQVYELLKLRAGVSQDPEHVKLIVQLGKELKNISPETSAEEVKKAKLTLFQHLKNDTPQTSTNRLGIIVSDNLMTLCKVRLNPVLTADTSPAVSALQETKDIDVLGTLRGFYPALTEAQRKDLSVHLNKWPTPDDSPARIEKAVCDEILQVVNGDVMTDEVFKKSIEDLNALKLQFNIRKAIELSSELIAKYPGSSLGYLQRANFRQGLNAAKHHDAIYRDIQIASYIQEHIEFYTRSRLELNVLSRIYYLDNFKLTEADFYHAEVLGLMYEDDKAFDEQNSFFDVRIERAIDTLKKSSPAKAYRLFAMRAEIAQNKLDQAKVEKIENLFDPLEVTSRDLLADCKGYALFKAPNFFDMDASTLKAFVNTPALRREIMDAVMATGYKSSYPLTNEEAMQLLVSHQPSINSDLIQETLLRIPYVKAKQLAKECNRLKEILNNLLLRVAKARVVTKADTNDIVTMYARMVKIERDIEIDIENNALKAAVEAGLDPLAFLDEEDDVAKNKPAAKTGKSKSAKRASKPKRGATLKATSPAPGSAAVTSQTLPAAIPSSTPTPTSQNSTPINQFAVTHAWKSPSHFSSITAPNDEKNEISSPVNFAWPSADFEDEILDEKKSATEQPMSVPVPKANLKPFLKWLSTSPVPAQPTKPVSVVPVASAPAPAPEVAPLIVSTSQSASLTSTEITPVDLQSAPCTPELTVQAASIGHIMELISLQAGNTDSSTTPPETILNLSDTHESDEQQQQPAVSHDNDEKQDGNPTENTSYSADTVLPEASQSETPAFTQADHSQITPEYVSQLQMQNMYFQFVIQEYARWHSVVASSLAANGCMLFPPNIPTPAEYMNSLMQLQYQFMQAQVDQASMPVPPPVVNPQPEPQPLPQVVSPMGGHYVSHVAPDNQRELYRSSGRHNHRHFHHAQNRDRVTRETNTHPYQRPAQPPRK